MNTKKNTLGFSGVSPLCVPLFSKENNTLRLLYTHLFLHSVSRINRNNIKYLRGKKHEKYTRVKKKLHVFFLPLVCPYRYFLTIYIIFTVY